MLHYAPSSDGEPVIAELGKEKGQVNDEI